MGQRKSKAPILQTAPEKRAPGDANLPSSSCPPSLEGQMLPWSQPDLWSEGGRGRARGRGAGWWWQRYPSLTLLHISPPESHPA